jgi:hypothetical protein
VGNPLRFDPAAIDASTRAIVGSDWTQRLLEMRQFRQFERHEKRRAAEATRLEFSFNRRYYQLVAATAVASAAETASAA